MVGAWSRKLLLGTLVLWTLCWRGEAKKSVAVIGGGMAGAAAVKFLREELGEEAEIVVYEREEVLGGRMAHEVLKHDNRPGYQNLEMGATLIYSGNHYAREMAEDMGLTKRVVKSQWFAFWDGRSFVWESLPNELLTSMSLFVRYNFSLMRLTRLINRVIQAFLRIYAIQANGENFETPKELLDAVGLYELTQQNITTFLGTHGVKGKIVTEVVAGVNGNNYNQGNSMNALVSPPSSCYALTAGSVSLCPMVSGDIFMLEEGNVQLPQRVIAAYASRAERKMSVSKVSILGEQRYRVWAGATALGDFDAVVLAAPLETAAIQIEGREGGSVVGVKAPRRKFQEVETTWVKGELRPAYFRSNEGWWGRVKSKVLRVLQGRGAELPAPSAIYLTQRGAEVEGFSSVERCGPGVYKFFSRGRLGEGVLSRLLERSWRVVARKQWAAAYPLFTAPEHFASFRLVRGERIYYPNAIENAASCLEMSAVAAKNVALLAAADLGAGDADSDKRSRARHSEL